jgi:superfamily I DNA/RNA helicase
LTAHSSTPTSLASSEQRDAIEAPIEARLLVLAGAGTGKTFVLSERIHHLVGTSDVAPGRELLVLSFTRAVVRELKDRIGAVGNAARLVRPITFDSFATRLLATMPDDQLAPGWRESGYDSRIAAAARALGTDEGKAVVAEYRHVFVDEIQDLVGVRATLVDALLARAFGFTLLGDPAQAIYDHQVRQATDTTSSESCVWRVRTRQPEHRTVTLHENIRTRGR